MEIRYKKGQIKNVDSIRIFGSYVRGEYNIHSDFDVLVILEKSQIINDSLLNDVEKLFDRKISISWYSKDRIFNLFKMGHLFSWHLYLESIPLCEDDFISTLGKPENYKYYFEDVYSLLEILEPIKDSVKEFPNNLVYESGLAYVCVRNIAISAFPIIKKTFSFSTQVPLSIGLPLSDEKFNKIKNSRYSSIRGIKEPTLSVEEFLEIYDIIYDWSKSILLTLKEFKNANREH